MNANTMIDREKWKNKLGSVELTRFIAMLIIMAHHVYILGYNKGEYPFYLGWMWVDFFFILTGYYTAKHFYRTDNAEENLSKTVMRYHIKKYKKFFVMAAVAMVLQFVINAMLYGYGIKSTVMDLCKLPYEVLFLTSSGISDASLAPIWYLSAVFITLPLVAILYIRLREYWYVVSWLIPLLYVGCFGVNTVREWPNDLLRSFSYLVLGTFVFLMIQELKKVQISSAVKLILTFIEIGSFLLAILITFVNFDTNLIVLLFVVNTILMLSEKSYTVCLSSRFASFLGQLSLPMFLFHWCIGTLVNRFTDNISVKLIVYYAGTIIVAVIAVLLQSIIHKRVKK